MAKQKVKNYYDGWREGVAYGLGAVTKYMNKMPEPFSKSELEFFIGFMLKTMEGAQG